MVIANTLTANIYRYSILALLIMLVLLVSSSGSHGVIQLILTVFLLLLIVLLFEIFTKPIDVNISVENMDNMGNINYIEDEYALEEIEDIGNMQSAQNVRGETLLNQTATIGLPPREILLASNQTDFNIPFDPRGIMIKRGNNIAPNDINYDKSSNFIPNEIEYNEDIYNYLNRGNIYEDRPGNNNTVDNLILSPKFGKQGYFIENGCNFGEVN